jgi:glycosyltransferase involved in cell wall biosynthesis
MPLKVLVISNYRETVSVRPEAELFIGLKKAGVDVTIMTYGDAEYVKKFKAAGIRVIDFHPEKKLNRTEIKYIRTELIVGKYDVMHLFNSKAIINGIQAAKKLPVKVVLYRGYTGNIHWYDPTAYFKYLHPRVDAIFCIAKSIEEYIRRQSIFYGKNKPVTINKGHSQEWYKNIKPIKRSELKNIPADGFWITCVANNRPMKGIPYLMEAMNLIPAEYPIHLILIGNNMDNEKNMSIIKNKPSENKIHFIGYRTDVLNIVKASDAFVLASLFGEATTKAVIEAMSLGVAPIITDIPGNKGLVVDGECGYVVPPANPRALADAIIKLHGDQATYERFGEKAKKHIESHFNIETTIKKTKLFYEQLTRAI